MSVTKSFVSLVGKSVSLAAVIGVSISSSNVQAQVLHLGISKTMAGSVTEGKMTTWKVKRDNKLIEMFTVVAEGSLAVLTGDPSDDDLQKAFNGNLKVRFELTGRTGTSSFGTLAAKYSWTDGTNTVEGYMTGVFGCNAVRRPVIEVTKDASPGVFNGMLTGDITAGPMKGQKIQAGFLGKLIFPSPTSLTARVYMNLDGVHILQGTTIK